jgi:hypothetical protein
MTAIIALAVLICTVVSGIYLAFRVERLDREMARQNDGILWEAGDDDD